MEVKTNGAYRITILIGDYAIKIPSFLYSQKSFIYGCYCNMSERLYCINHGTENVSPSLFCSWFGLIQIQRRCKSLERDLTLEEVQEYKYLHCDDIKKENFGYYEGKLVCLDYP